MRSLPPARALPHARRSAELSWHYLGSCGGAKAERGSVLAAGQMNEDDMIGYLAKADGIKLVNWPDRTVFIDRYG